MYNASRISFTVKAEIYICSNILCAYMRGATKKRILVLDFLWTWSNRSRQWKVASSKLDTSKKGPNSLGEGNTLHREVVWVNVSRWLLLTTEIISGNYEFRLHCFINYILNLTAHAKLSDTWGCDTHKLICQDM